MFRFLQNHSHIRRAVPVSERVLSLDCCVMGFIEKPDGTGILPDINSAQPRYLTFSIQVPGSPMIREERSGPKRLPQRTRYRKRTPDSGYISSKRYPRLKTPIAVFSTVPTVWNSGSILSSLNKCPFYVFFTKRKNRLMLFVRLQSDHEKTSCQHRSVNEHTYMICLLL